MLLFLRRVMLVIASGIVFALLTMAFVVTLAITFGDGEWTVWVLLFLVIPAMIAGLGVGAWMAMGLTAQPPPKNEPRGFEMTPTKRS